MSWLARFAYLAGFIGAMGLAVTSIVPLQPDIMEVSEQKFFFFAYLLGFIGAIGLAITRIVPLCTLTWKLSGGKK